MTRKTAHRSVSLAVLVVLAAAVGAVGAIGTVGAQDDGTNTTANATDGDFYNPSDENPVNARFRDCCANTVDSTDGGVLNFYIVNGQYDGDPYDVDISASDLSEAQVDEITFGNDTEFSPYGLDRGDIVGMDFSGVPAGDYDFTVTVVGADTETTVPLSVTGESEAANETTTNETATNETADNETTNATANETTGTQTETAGNTTVMAAPSTANTSANHTVSTVVGADATGNLSEVTVNYGDSNTSIGLVGGQIHSANLNEEVIINNSTIPTVGAQERNLTIGFDGTVQVEQGDRLNLTYGGVTNPTEADDYTVGVAVNNGSFQNTTFAISENATGGAAENATNATTDTNATTGTNVTTGSGNVSVTADPATAGTESAFHNVSVVAGADAEGNLSQVTVNYGDSNTSIGLVGGNIASATLNDEDIINNSTVPTVGVNGRNLSVGFDGTLTVEEGDRVTMNYSGVTNPTEAGDYTVGVAVNNESFQNTTLAISENTTAGAGGSNATSTAATTSGETTSAGTTSGEATTSGDTAATTGGANGSTSGGAGTNGSGDQQGTDAGGPGFGIAIAVVALLAAALLAVRRN